MGRRLWWLVLAAVVLGIALWFRYCRIQIAQCPDHDTFQAAGPNGATAVSEVRLAGATTFIPEFHDCQRLIDEQDRGRFGILAAVWVSESLGVLADSLAKLNAPGMWIHPSGDSGWVAQDTSHWGPTDSVAPRLITALPFAVVHAWDGNYERLGIHKGWNCLYLYPSPVGIGYAARMVPVGDHAECFDPRLASDLQGGHALMVTPLVIDGMSEKQFPAVGRWDTDAKSNLHYIGLKCGAAWCEVTPFGHYTSSAVYGGGATLAGPATNPTSPARQVVAIKGWYDEQRIALGTNPTTLTPANFRGIVIPDPALDSRTPFPSDTWIPAGWAALEQANAEYQSKLNIAPGKLPPAGTPEGGTDVWLCKHRGGCDFGNQTAPACAANADGSTWYARMQARVTGEIRYTCLTRRAHEGTGRHIPGTARWRWDPKDERLWFRCDDGCCTTY